MIRNVVCGQRIEEIKARNPQKAQNKQSVFFDILFNFVAQNGVQFPLFLKIYVIFSRCRSKRIDEIIGRFHIAVEITKSFRMHSVTLL